MKESAAKFERAPSLTDASRTALVSGAASGIGRATAIRLASDGYHLALLDVDEEGLLRTQHSITSTGGTAHVLVCDVRHHSELAAMIGRAHSEYERLDLLVNVAGIGVAATTPETDPADWDRMLDVNLTAVFHSCRVAIPLMIAAGGGVIVNVSSVAGLVGLARRAAYCATKAGVIGLTRAIAADHAAEGIRANAICPGTVDTEWIGKILAGSSDPSATREAMESRQLDGRMGTAEEVAAGISFLASKEARFVNGSAFVMDGGMTAV